MKILPRTRQTGLVAISMLAVATPLYAQDQSHNLNIGPQSVAGALKALANQTHLQIVSDGSALQDRQTQGVKGLYTNRAAIQKLLAGTGLTYTFTADNAVAVKQLNKAEPATLAPMTVSAEREYDDTDPYNPTYVQPDATTGTKTDTPIMETPLNVQVITKQVMKDQQVIQLDQALKNVSGVTTAGNGFSGGGDGGIGTGQSLFLRGIFTNTMFRNGFRLQQGSGVREMANVESVEVLKGSAAVLYGLVDPGGMVNVITKQPLATPYYALGQQFGSYNLYRTTIDATGPLTPDDTLLYRMNLSYQNSGSFREFVNTDDVFVAPVLKWNISPRTQATVELEYNHQHKGLDAGAVPFLNGQLLNAPRSRNYGEYSPGTVESIFGGFNWSHQFNDDWSIKHSFAVNQQHDTTALVYPFSSDNVNVSRINYGQNNQYNTYSTNLDLTGHFNTWGLKHTLLLGGDYYRLDTTKNFSFSLNPDTFFDFSQIGLFNPSHPGTPFTSSPQLGLVQSFQTDQYGLYVQDQIKLPYNVEVMGGIRYQNLHQVNGQDTTAAYGGPSSISTVLSADAVTPRVGIVWQPQSWVSLYANYTENFGPNEGTVFPNSLVPPSSANQYEGGIKTEFFGGRLRSTLAYYDLTKTNVTTNDPAHPGFSIAQGAVHSRGPELDIQGEILPGWNVIATYANVDARISKSNSTDLGGDSVGTRMFNVPRNTGSVWNTYELQNGVLKGLKFGGGVTLRDGQEACCDAPRYRLAGYATVDLLAAYNFKVGKSKVSAQLNVNNLLDKHYFSGISTFRDSSQMAWADFGQPRTFMGSIRVEY